MFILYLNLNGKVINGSSYTNIALLGFKTKATSTIFPDLITCL